MTEGIYESLVTKLIATKLEEVDKSSYYINEVKVDKEEAAAILAGHISKILKYALSLIKSDVGRQIEIANEIILLLKSELGKEEFEDDLILEDGRILKAILTKLNSDFSDFDLRLKQIIPSSRLLHSELFVGGNSEITLESELRKEILSSDKINLLVSFIKWKGIIILEKELREFTEKGGKLRVISTTYMGASDQKAIQLLASLKNTQVKISYNSGNERLHAKAYLFLRNTGFHTGYIGSSNFSRSALTDGLEWNLKVTTNEVGHIIEKFQNTFEAYWQNPEFELYDNEKHIEKLQTALHQARFTKEISLQTSFFDVKPYHYQLEILEKLNAERVLHGRFKNLLVAATGTGKTVISAFDYKQFQQDNPNASLLFVAHRKEILLQARSTFQGILKDNNFGEIWVDGYRPLNFKQVFASVQSLNNSLSDLTLDKDYYDFVIIDEVHHIAAKSYRPILEFFQPKILLGLTATPERMDGEDILSDFCNRIAAEIRLPEALNKKLLCPFQYFGISDSVDLSSVKWVNGRYLASELTDLYTSNDRRVGDVISSLNKYTNDPSNVACLGFCITIEHATYMAEKFVLAGFKAGVLTSKNSAERDLILKQFKSKELNYLFVVDIFNEGVDIPQIDTLLFLRPTESLTVFLQQLGRGLRLFEGKDALTVLDFVGNARPEYDFEMKFRALIGKTNSSVQKEVEDEFPHLPLGCSIILEKKAKEHILENIRRATSSNRKQLVLRIQNFEHQFLSPLTLSNFLTFSNIKINTIYKKDSWSRLCVEANRLPNFSSKNEKEIAGAIKNKWISTVSSTYFNFILNLAKNDFKVHLDELDANEKKMLLMLHYDVWQNAGVFSTIQESIRAIGENKIMVNEIIAVLEYLLDGIGFIEKDIRLPYEQPLKVHARYTRDQILVAFEDSTFEKKSSNREGVYENKSLNTELLFIDLFKSEEDYSPTTMYNDYAISETIFHWQSQNQTRADRGKGLTYINQEENNKIILLFVREQSKDEYGNTIGYVFLGDGTFETHYGSKPMSINWKLSEPMPNYLWKQSAKLSVG
ncbi:MAG: DUF3427 domain-containing protein [Flavobacterium sp.]|uniref:DEAD/DEAH box helicase n=1 Tax=Flavobacterium sp. TaxID=239 RepID=UPI0012293D77|nr:DEAD/DEAH box helicase [Flavobacterium sp.]RZJ68481.1 MAG: DUF3427 domain-containing protein [Flavobacterium sp.]